MQNTLGFPLEASIPQLFHSITETRMLPYLVLPKKVLLETEKVLGSKGC